MNWKEINKCFYGSHYKYIKQCIHKVAREALGHNKTKPTGGIWKLGKNHQIKGKYHQKYLPINIDSDKI